MNRKRQVWYGLMAIVALAALTLGCLGTGIGTARRTPVGRAEATPTPRAAKATPTPRAKAPAPSTKGAILRLPGYGGDPTTLDPALAGDVTSAEYIVEIFSGLVTLDKNLQVKPDIAERWEVSPDKKTYTFHLRKDVRFHSGKQVTAKDFKYSIERACDPRTGSTVADTYLGDIIGAREKLRGQAREVKGVRVVDDYTLEITIDAPKAYFLSKLTYPTAFVVDQENIQRGGRTWTDRPNGTGPFKLERYEIGEEIVLVRNDNFYGPKPALERAVFPLTGGSMMTMYENGELEAVPVGIIDIDRVLDPANPLNKELTISPSFATFYIALNTQAPPFDDVKVRRAFDMALNKELLAEVVLKGMVQPAKGPLPAGMPGYNPKLEGLPFDIQRAKALIAESKYGSVEKLPEITFHISGMGGSVGPVTSAIIEMWKIVLGVEVAIQQTETAIFFSDISKTPNPYQMFSIGWVADYPDPQNFLEIKFHSKSENNNIGYSNPQVDKLLDQAGAETDESKRIALYQEVEKLIVQDAAWICLWYDTNYWLTKPYVKGLIYPPLVIPRLGYVSIEPH